MLNFYIILNMYTFVNVFAVHFQRNVKHGVHTITIIWSLSPAL